MTPAALHTAAAAVQLPEMALSVRQPWAWAIVAGHKHLENRSAKAISFMVPVRGRRAIHAAKGMTQAEYAEAYEFMRGQGVICPPPGALIRGAIIGSVDVIDWTKFSTDPWFFGPRALVLRNARACEPIASVGALGYFRWKPSFGAIEAPLPWMLPKAAKAFKAAAESTPDLFGQRDPS